MQPKTGYDRFWVTLAQSLHFLCERCVCEVVYCVWCCVVVTSFCSWFLRNIASSEDISIILDTPSL